MRPFWLPFLVLLSPAAAAEIEIHYAPAENLETVDVGLIDAAGDRIDMAAYVLTDDKVIEALGDAADRGVAVRIYLDREQFGAHGRQIAGLIARPGVALRVKPAGVLMHLKAYAVDGERLRTGSGNFSRSGLSLQDNDLLVIDDAGAVGRFERDFDAIFAQGVSPATVAGD